MRESEGTAPSIIFREESEGPRGAHHATGSTANLREKVLREVSVNTSIQFDFMKTFPDSLFAGVALPSSNLHCHAVHFKFLYRHWVLVVCYDAPLHVVAIFKTINLSINVSLP